MTSAPCLETPFSNPTWDGIKRTAWLVFRTVIWWTSPSSFEGSDRREWDFKSGKLATASAQSQPLQPPACSPQKTKAPEQESDTAPPPGSCLGVEASGWSEISPVSGPAQSLGRLDLSLGSQEMGTEGCESYMSSQLMMCIFVYIPVSCPHAANLNPE